MTVSYSQVQNFLHKLKAIQNLLHIHYLYLQTQFGDDRCTQFRVIIVRSVRIIVKLLLSTELQAFYAALE